MEQLVSFTFCLNFGGEIERWKVEDPPVLASVDNCLLVNHLEFCVRVFRGINTLS